MWAGRRVLPSKGGSHAACCGMLYLLTTLRVHVCLAVPLCVYKMDITQQYELEG